VFYQVGDPVSNQVSNQVRNQVINQVLAQVSNQVFDQVSDQVSGQVRDQVRNQVSNQVRGQVSNQVRGQVSGQVGDQVSGQVINQVSNQVRGQVSDQVSGQVGGYLLNLSEYSDEWSDVYSFMYGGTWGSFDAGWLSFYDFFKEICSVECCNRLEPLMRFSENCGWAWLYADFAILTEKPTLISRNDRNALHCETGPALQYADGYSLYSLNGVRVTKQIIETAPDDFTKEMVLGEKNVDIRRELFRKIGINNFLKKIGGITIHKYKDYELIEVDFEDGKKRRGLKMKNPSIDAQHFERVSDECNTCQEALAWRAGTNKFVEPVILT
jgi:hypothetical protein